MHGIQDAAVDWLQPIAGIRQGARHDHAHGVIQVRRAHLVVDIDLLNGSYVHYYLLLCKQEAHLNFLKIPA